MQVLNVSAYPNPNPNHLLAELSGGPAPLEIQIFSVSMRLVASFTTEPLGPAWVELPLSSGFLAEAGGGLYYFRVRPLSQANGGKIGRFMVLR